MWSFSPQDNVFLPFLPPGLPSFVFYHFQFLSYLKKENKTKTSTDLKAFHYYLFLTAVVLQKVKQMMFLILYFQRILAKPWCSLGTTNQGNLESLLTSWVHGSPLSLPWTEAGTGWGVLTPNAKQRPKVSEPGGGVGCTPMDPWPQQRVCPSFKLDAVSVSWPTSHLPSATSAADMEVSCPATPLLFPSTKTTVPLKIICLILTVPQTYANPLWQCIYKNFQTEKPSTCMKLHYNNPSPEGQELNGIHTTGPWVHCSVLLRVEKDAWSCRHLTCAELQRAQRSGNQPHSMPQCFPFSPLKKQTQSKCF